MNEKTNIPNKIGEFSVDKSKTTMKYGFYYKADFDVPFSQEKRTVRVWLPGDYDFNNSEIRFPVIYFSDGQNLVNEYLTAFGDWDLDKVWHKLYKEKGISFIAVGIDSPSDDKKRSNELNPPYLPTIDKNIDDPKGDVFVDYIADTLRPYIDENFNTVTGKKYTGIGGSSMGGIMAFYGGVGRNDVFGFSLDFSPAFLLYKSREWKKILKSMKINKEMNTKFFFYVGGVKFEKLFVSTTVMTYKYLKEIGFEEQQVAFIFDSRMKHHESAWNKYLYDALYFWLDKKYFLEN